MADDVRRADYYPNAPDPQDSELQRALMQHVANKPRPDIAAAMLMPAFNPTNGMSTYDRLAAGAGQGLTDANLSTMQFLTSNPMIAHALGYGAYASPEMKKAVEQAAKEKAATDAPLLGTDAGKVGSVAGQTALYALLK